MFLQQDSSTLSYQSSFHQPRDDHVTESSTEDCRIFHHYLLRISAFPVRLSISRFQETYEDTISWRSKAQAVPDSDSMSDMFFEHCGPPSPNPTKKICRGYDRIPPPFPSYIRPRLPGHCIRIGFAGFQVKIGSGSSTTSDKEVSGFLSAAS